MVGWHHRLDGHECEKALGAGDRQGGLDAAVHSQRVGHSWATELEKELSSVHLQQYWFQINMKKLKKKKKKKLGDDKMLLKAKCFVMF